MNEAIDAYVGIVTKPGANNTVIETLSDRFLDVSPFKVIGPYSLLVKIRAENEKELRDKIYSIKRPSVPGCYNIRRLMPFIILNEKLNPHYIEMSERLGRSSVDQIRGPDAFVFIQTMPQRNKDVQEEILKMDYLSPEFRSASIVTGDVDIIAELYWEDINDGYKHANEIVNHTIGVTHQFLVPVVRDYRDARERLAELLKTQS